MRVLSYGNKLRNKLIPATEQMNCEETNRKAENETQITATEERHEIIVLHVDGKKKRQRY